MLVLIMEKLNLDLLNVFFLAIKMVLKGTSYGVLRLVRSLFAEMLFLMKMLCCGIHLLMTLVTQVNRNQECRWIYIIKQSLYSSVFIR